MQPDFCGCLMMGGANIGIPYTGLKEGRHHFGFEIGDDFFSGFENTVVNRGRIKAMVTMEKGKNSVELEISLKGTIEAECDLCLEFFSLPVEFCGKLIVKQGDGEEDGEMIDDGFITVRDCDSDINLSQYVYESICLSVPYKKVHPTDEKGIKGCNPEMLERLALLKADGPAPETDPRWDVLKKLKDNK